MCVDRMPKHLQTPTKTKQTLTCGDAIFSGHTTCLTMCSMIFRCVNALHVCVRVGFGVDHHQPKMLPIKHSKYCRGKYLCTKIFFRQFLIPESACLVARRLVYLINAIGALLIISTKFHYTLDVAIGLTLTPLCFILYHHSIKYPSLLKVHKRLRQGHTTTTTTTTNLTLQPTTHTRTGWGPGVPAVDGAGGHPGDRRACLPNIQEERVMRS